MAKLRNLIFPLKRENTPMLIGGKKSMLQPSHKNNHIQVITTTTFMGQQEKQTLNILFKLNCKGQHVIYLMKCILCQICWESRDGI